MTKGFMRSNEKSFGTFYKIAVGRLNIGYGNNMIPPSTMVSFGSADSHIMA